jgi:hypothetical protein
VSTIATSQAPPVDGWPPRACLGKDTDMWFPVHGAHGAQLLRAQAKRVCWTCKARTACGEYAIPIVELDGIWAAMTPGEREQERKQRQQKEA